MRQLNRFCERYPLVGWPLRILFGITVLVGGMGLAALIIGGAITAVAWPLVWLVGGPAVGVAILLGLAYVAGVGMRR